MNATKTSTTRTVRVKWEISGAQPLQLPYGSPIRIVPGQVVAEWVDGELRGCKVSGGRLLADGTTSAKSIHAAHMSTWERELWPTWLTSLVGGETTDGTAPRWRTVITDTESESGVAPVCPRQAEPGGPHDLGYDHLDQWHGLDEHSVYDCCPGCPHLECSSPHLARELAAWLNQHEIGVCD